MLARRSLLMIAGLAALTSSCRLFRPIDPATGSANPTDSALAATQRTRSESQPGARAQGDERLTDANIAAIVLASNNTDISYARLVPSRSERDDVKTFAERMLTDHTGVNGLINDLLARLDIGPEDNVMSLDLRDESADKRDMMRELEGYKFDSTYIENEVAYHKKFLATIDDVLSPRATAIELKGLLSAVRPAVAAHLAHAEQVRANVVAKR